MIIVKYVIKFITYIICVIILRPILKRQKKERTNRRVLVQINSGIGDSILALPMIHELSVKGYEVYAIVNKSVETIAKLCPDISRYCTLDYKILKFLRIFRQIYSLNKLKFKYFIGALPSNLVRDAFLPAILRIPIRIKHISPHKEIYRNYDFLSNKVIEVDYKKNNAESNLLLLSSMDEHLEFGERKFNIDLPVDSIINVKKNLISAGYSEEKITVGIHPGCKETWAFKRWPPERFADLISQLGKRENLQIILFGGPDEIGLSEHIVQKSSITPLNLSGKLSLEETMCAINLCKLFISNDSGLMHIATVFDIPVIGLFGPTGNEVATGPYGAKHVVIKKDALDDITVGEVYKEAVRLLDRINQTVELQE